MKTQPQIDTIKIGRAEIEALWNSLEYLPEIDKIKESINRKASAITPDELSRAAFQLAMYLVNLGQLVAELSAKANENYTYRKYRFLWEFNSLAKKLSVKEKEDISMDNIFDEQRQELVSRFVADFVKGYKDDIERLVSVMQSRIGYLKQEHFKSNLQT